MRESNHMVCEISRLFTFEHFVNFSQISAIMRVFKNKMCPFLSKMSFFLKINSAYINRARILMSSKYGVHNLFDNDIDAIRSRMLFIQSREPTLR